MRLPARALAPIFSNLPLFMLSWSLVAIVALLSRDPNCKDIDIGSLVQLALGLPLKNFVVWLFGFYLVLGIIFSATGKHERLVEIQNKFLRPVAVPVLFQLAGFFGGLTAESDGTFPLLRAAVIATAVIALALLAHNAADLLGSAPNPTEGKA